MWVLPIFICTMVLALAWPPPCSSGPLINDETLHGGFRWHDEALGREHNESAAPLGSTPSGFSAAQRVGLLVPGAPRPLQRLPGPRPPPLYDRNSAVRLLRRRLGRQLCVPVPASASGDSGTTSLSSTPAASPAVSASPLHSAEQHHRSTAQSGSSRSIGGKPLLRQY